MCSSRTLFTLGYTLLMHNLDFTGRHIQIQTLRVQDSTYTLWASIPCSLPSTCLFNTKQFTQILIPFPWDKEDWNFNPQVGLSTSTARFWISDQQPKRCVNRKNQPSLWSTEHDCLKSFGKKRAPLACRNLMRRPPAFEKHKSNKSGSQPGISSMVTC